MCCCRCTGLWTITYNFLIFKKSSSQSQTTTVDRQMRRYNVPRISFVNKMDRYEKAMPMIYRHAHSSCNRPGANPWRIINQIRTKLRMPAAAVQVPIGVEDEFKGVVDLVRWKSIYNQGEKGSAFLFFQCCTTLTFLTLQD